MPTVETIEQIASCQDKQKLLPDLVEFLSVILMNHQGQIETSIKQPYQRYFLKKQILINDIQDSPGLFMKTITNFLVHQVMLVDLLGI